MKKTLFLFALPLLFISFSYAQEICNDGIDNDGDGFIDCFDGDCATSNACDGFYLGNDISCNVTPNVFSPINISLAYISPAETALNLSTIAIGDLDRDGMPEILSTHRYANKIYLLNGDDASIKEEASVASPGFSSAAMANLQDDNCGEVFVISNTGSFMINSFDCNLNPLWTSEPLPRDPFTLGFADFDRDGQAEMYYKDEIRDPITGARIVASTTADWRSIGAGPVAVDILGDEDLELVLGNKIYSVNLGARTTDAGSLTLMATMPEGYQATYNGGVAATSIADYNLDGHLDVLLTGADAANITTVFYWDVHNNSVKKFSHRIDENNYRNGWRNGTGRINIGDIDGDGQLNATFISGKYMYALDENWEPLWKDVVGDPQPIIVNEETSGVTGSTLFDFNGDGKTEIIYRDEDYLYIIDGNGNINTSLHCRSRTNLEYPIVADVDADGSSEICITCASESFNPTTTGAQLSLDDPAEVRIYKSGGAPWAASRKVWNQHAYFNVNINDDLTVPQNQQKHQLVWSTGTCAPGAVRPLNSFLNQSPFLSSGGCPTFAAADLSIIENTFTVSAPACPDTDFTVSFDFENIGDIPLTGNIPVTFYDGDPTVAGTNKLNSVVLDFANLQVGDTTSAVHLAVNGSGAPFTLYAVLNDNGTSTPAPITLPSTNFLECDYTNNIVAAEVNPTPFSLTIATTKNIRCAIGSTSPNGSASASAIIDEVDETASHDFHWFNGSAVGETADFTGSTYTGLAAGNYSVYAINKTTACSSDTVQVEITDSIRTLDVAITVVNGNSDCLNPNGQLTVDIDGGAPVNNYEYEWYVGNTVGGGLTISTTHNANNLEAGIYTVLVTEKATGCTTIESIEVPDEIVPPAVNAGEDIETCTAVVTLAANASAANETGTWSIVSEPNGISTPATFDNVHIASTNFNIVDETVSGDYILRWTITDDNVSCNAAFEEITITYETAPNAGSFNATVAETLTLADSPFDLFSLLDAEDTAGEWALTVFENGDGSTPTFDASNGLLNLTGADAGIYEFTYTVNGTLACATDSESVIIDFRNYDCSLFNLTTTTTDASCAENADGGLTLLFNQVSETDSLILNFSADQTNTFSLKVENPGIGGTIALDYGFIAGDYQLIAEDLLWNCLDTISFSIGFGEPITTEIINTQNEDYGAAGNGSITIETINSGGAYEIFLNGTAYESVLAGTQQLIIEDLSAGTYNIEVVDLSSGCSTSVNTDIFENPNTATDIFAFSIVEQAGAAIIDASNHTIEIEVPYGTDLTSLQADVEISAGATISPIAGTPIDFSTPVTFTITAEDGVTTQSWQVTVSILPIIKQDQSISFELPAILYQDQSPYALEASASSGLAVEFAVVSGSATVENNQLILTGASTVVVKAFQVGNDSIAYAEVEKSSQVLGMYDVSINVLRPNNIPLESGVAKLFTLAGELYAKENFTTGNLSFSNVRNGDYILQVIPLGSNTSDIFPSYYNDTHFHKEATILQVASDLSLSLYMKEKSSTANQGEGKINGRVIKSEDPANARIAIGQSNTGEGIAELIIYLVDAGNGEIIRSAVTDSIGNFSMLDIAAGQYELLIDLPGLSNEATSFELPYDAENLSISLTIFLNSIGITDVEINTVLGTEKTDFTLKVFPNPTSGLLNLYGYHGPKQQIEIITSTGVVIKTIELTANTYQKIDISDLEAGVYFLVTKDKKERLIKIIKK